MVQTASLRPSSVSCKTRPLTEGKTLTCSSKRFRRLPSLPATPVKLNLDENADGGVRDPKEYTSEVGESSLWASIRDYLTPLDVLATRTAGLIMVSSTQDAGHAWSTS